MVFGSGGEFDGRMAALMAVCTAVGGGVTWLANHLTARRKDRRAEQQEDERTTIQRYDDLLKRVNADRLESLAEIKGLRAEVEELREHVTRLEVTNAKYRLRIAHLEEILELRGVPFKPWADDDGPHPHPALPPAHSPPTPGGDR